MSTIGKIAKMQNRVEFIIGYRNLINLLLVFFGVTYLTLQGSTVDGFVVGAFTLILGLTRFYDRVIMNIDELEIQDTLKKEGS